MTYDELKILLGNSPAIKLLRAKNAPLLLSFFSREFKETGRLVINNHDLVTQLADYLEALNFEDEEMDADGVSYEGYVERAKRYIDDWCNEENRYLRKFPNEMGESVHELTAETEKVFQWIESMKKKEFIGTESRFLDIFAKLKALIENSNEDPEKKIEELERKKLKIEEEIRNIKESGRVESYSDTQIKERFFEICKLARELNSDFKEVEQNFKDITRSIYEKQMQDDITKGGILGFALDATEALKESDQGKSFYAFWLFLIASDRQDELTTLINQVYIILEEKEISASDPYLRNIKVYLHNSGQKVVESNHRLADKLSNVLTESHLMDRKKTMSLINDIKRAAIERLDTPPRQSAFIEVEGNADIRLTMDRPLGEPQQLAAFIRQPEDIGSESLKPSEFESIFERFEIDKKQLKSQIDIMLEKQGQVSLTRVLESYPLGNGLAEIVAYLSIASEYPEHIINDDESITLIYYDDEKETKVNLPQVIYVNSRYTLTSG